MSFHEQRVAKIKDSCMDCCVVGICRGGCVMNGLSAFNHPIEGGCSFRKAMWTSYVGDLI
jgi:radical SAM protein with 4Fe4S-binding SPASM domain